MAIQISLETKAKLNNARIFDQKIMKGKDYEENYKWKKIRY